jgi:hypothetical protein
MVPIGEYGPAPAHLVREGLVATTWWRLELRSGSAPTGDVLVLTNPVYVTGGTRSTSQRTG